MLTKDYIMRMVDTLIRVIERLLELKRGNNTEEGFLEIDKLTKEFFGFDRKFIDSLSDAQLIKMISNNESLISPNCYLLGVIFKEEADLYKLRNDQEKYIEMSERSLYFFVEGLKTNPVLIEPEHLKIVDTVAGRLKDMEINIDTEESLFFYYEFRGKFDEAENLIFDLIDYDPKYIADGIRFCQRLLQKPNEILTNGNLPREEVEESLVLLNKKINQNN